MPGRFIYNPITKLDEENPNLDHMVEELNEQLNKVKQAFDTIGMCYGYAVNVADTGSASTDFAVEHLLGAEPDGVIPIKVSKPCRIWAGGGTWDANNIYLQTDKSNVDVTILVIIDTN